MSAVRAEASTARGPRPAEAAHEQVADAESRTLHMIGNTHIDPVWLWQWQEGFQEVKSTFRAVLDLMRESADLVFTTGSAAFHEWVEKNEPEMFEEIRARVAEGRWCIVAGWWVEPDCNIPAGESYVRQALYSQRYFQQKLGVTATVGYNVDSFGHNAMLPQILSRSGLISYVFQRPEPNEKQLPARVFWWESPDGSRVLAQRIPFGYGSGPGKLDEHVGRCAGEIGDQFPELMCFYGVGNHGGGPTRANLESIRRLNDDAGVPRLVHSTPNRFFQAARSSGAEFPVVRDELQHHARGCYSAHSGVKRWNRQAENALLSAEKLSAIAELVAGQPYPADFERAWKDVLFNQFHDVLAGTAIEPAYDDARDAYGEAMAIASRNSNHAVQAIARRIRIDYLDGQKAIVVFNPHAWRSTVPVELEIRALEETDALLDDAGAPVPMQPVRAYGVASGRGRLCFVADLPPMGYRVYRLLRGDRRPEPQARIGTRAPGWPAPDGEASLAADDRTLENDLVRVAIDPRDGLVTLFDKRSGAEVLAGGARGAVMDDPSDTWGHGWIRWDDEAGNFRVSAVRRVESGPVRAVVRVESECGGSRLFQDFTLYGGIARVDVHVTVDWHERNKLLKLRFPVTADSPVATFEIPYGHLVRPANGEEVPGQSWVDVSGRLMGGGGAGGLSVLNDGKYSYDVRGGDIGLTVLRSPIYAHHVPYLPQPEGHYTYQDQGSQRFTYALLPHEGSWEKAGTVRQAAELNQRAVALIETHHDGPLPHAGWHVDVDSDNVVVSAVKRAEDGDDLVLRAYETAGVATDATIRVHPVGREITTAFGPSEIKTVLVPRDPALPARETNLIEWPI